METKNEILTGREINDRMSTWSREFHASIEFFPALCQLCPPEGEIPLWPSGAHNLMHPNASADVMTVTGNLKEVSSFC